MREGKWSDAALSPALPPRVSVQLKLTSDMLELGLPLKASDAALDLALSADKLNIDLREGQFGGGRIKGAIAATLRDGEAEVSLTGGLDGGDLQSLIWEHGGLPIASGGISSWAETPFGRS